MRLDATCDSISSITSKNFMHTSDGLCNGKFQSHSRVRLLHNSVTRKEKTTSIFSFLQRFRAKNKKLLENVTSLPSSPRPNRVVRSTNSRWESVESVLSSATTTSFAFISPSQLISNSKVLHNSINKPQESNYSIIADVEPIPARDSALFIRRKYNLFGSDTSLYSKQEEQNSNNSLKKFHRNSVGNTENLRWETWPEQELFASFRRPVRSNEHVPRPKSEYDISKEVNRTRKVYCHKPGKGRAPQPPTKSSIAKIPSFKVQGNTVPLKKKRKAPSPPKDKMEKNSECDSGDITEEIKHEKMKEGAVYNDSLKLEKGQLKANKSSSVICTSSALTEISAPVSPKPWYKRSSTRKHKKSSSKSFDKRKTCEQLLDEWMLEAGLPRSSSFYDEQKYSFFSETEKIGKRRSQISMLANISELDREAAEIVQKEQRKERSTAVSIDDRFYEHSSLTNENNSNDTFHSTVEVIPSRRNSPKDLISVLNAITNVTKITKSSSFFRENAGSSCNRQLPNSILNSERSNASPDITKTSNKLKITELEDFDKEFKVMTMSQHLKENKSEPQMRQNFEVTSRVSNEKPSEPIKPTKPFSSWMCPQCTLENPSWKFICEACNKWRPYTVTKVKGNRTPLITPKEDIKLHFNHGTLGGEHEEIDKISQNIRKQVYDILTSGKTVRNNLSKLKINDNHKKNTLTKESKFDSPWKQQTVHRIDENIEEIRKARIVFFSKNHLNNLNFTVSEPMKKSPPMNVQSVQEKNKYNEEDRKKLRDILKELKDSLPKNSSLEVSRLDKQQLNDSKDHFSLSNEMNNPTGDIKKKLLEEITSSRLKFTKDLCGDINIPHLENQEISCIDEKSRNVETNSDGVGENVLMEKMYSQISKKIPPCSNLDSNIQRLQNNEVNVQVLNILNTDTGDQKDLEYLNDLKHCNNLKKILRYETTETVNSNLEKLNNQDTWNILYQNIESCKDPENSSKQKHEDLNQQSDFKNTIDNPKENKNLNSLAVNRLLKKLQTAIASGQHHEAANIARDLARLKVNCHVTKQDTHEQQPIVTVDLSFQRGVTNQRTIASSLKLKLSPLMTLNDLKKKLFKEQNIPLQSQNFWLNGKLITDGDATLELISRGSFEVHIFVSATISENKETSLSIQNEFLTEEEKLKSILESGSGGQVVSDSPPLIDAGSVALSIDKNINKDDSVLNSQHQINIKGEDYSTANLDDKKNCFTVFENGKNMQIKLTESKTKSSSSSSSEWKCPRCTLINTVKDKTCLACDGTFLNEAGPSCRTDENTELKLANYQELISMEMNDIIKNTASFECSVCLLEYPPGEGIILKDCLHTFCKECLIQTVQHSTEAEVKCPFRDENYSCESALQEREIKALVSAEIYEQHLARSVAEAENKMQNTFHCKTVNCIGWCIFEDNVNEFHCPVCDKINCLTCQVIHAGMNCKQYQEFINKDAETNADANRTKTMLLEMIQKEEAMSCPTCQIIVMKKWGCDWLRCSMCKTEICWVTRGPRWGPKGKGDTSAGCKCGVKGVKCHPRCTYCH